jgi:flagellar biosynthetic protein FlhB
MAEDSDDSEKTEEPTGKRLSDAAEKGDVIQSAELKHLIVLFAATLVMVTMSGTMAVQVVTRTITFLQQPHTIPFDGGHLVVVLHQIGLDLLVVLGLPVLFLMIASIASSAVQNPLSFNFDRLSIDLGRLSLVSGIGRLVGTDALIELGKGIVKLLLIGGTGFFVFWQHRKEIPGFIQVDLAQMLAMTMALVLKMLIAMLIVQALLAAADYFINRFRFMQRHRMTRQEVKEEAKQSEGDPLIKGRIRGLRMQRARQRMMQAVPQATVVVTNPTHYAVALKYEEDTMAAPICVAKGADLVAARIRELAEENGVPLVANPPLARALFATVEIEQPVPPQHFKAVAEVIGFVWRLKGKKANAPPKSQPDAAAGNRDALTRSDGAGL